MSEQPARPAFRRDIQGLRAIAVLAVMAFHANEAWLPAGFIGVDMFFVISGFIVSRIVLDRAGRFDWWGFYGGRLRRIVPAYYLVLAVVTLGAVLLLIPQDFGFFRDSLKSALIFNSNNYFSGFGDYFAPSSHELPLLHTWSLAIEMQFYLVLPILLIWLPRACLKYALPLLVAAAIAWSEYQIRHQVSMYFSFLARSAEFGFGIWLASVGTALSLSKRWAEFASAGGALLLLTGFLVTPAAHFPGVWVLLPCMGTLLIMAAPGARLNHVLSNPVLVGIGAISYSLYLWHWPVLAFIRYVTQQYALSAAWVVVYCLAAFALAGISYRYIEVPFRKKGSRHGLGLRRAAAVLTAAGLAGMVLRGGVLNAGVTGTLPLERTRYADAEKICHGQVVADCIRGERGKKPVALVIGDSHAAQLNLAFDELGQARGQSFQVVTGSSCVPIEGFDVERLPQWAQQACLEQIAYARPLIASADTIVLAAMWQYQTQSPAFMRALEKFLSVMQGQGTKVVVLGQVPMLEANVARMQRFAVLGLAEPIRLVPMEHSEGMVRSLANRYDNTQFIDVSMFALLKHPPFYKAGVMYMDSHHLNEVGAYEYGQELGKVFLTLPQRTAKE